MIVNGTLVFEIRQTKEKIPEDDSILDEVLSEENFRALGFRDEMPSGNPKGPWWMHSEMNGVRFYEIPTPRLLFKTLRAEAGMDAKMEAASTTAAPKEAPQRVTPEDPQHKFAFKDLDEYETLCGFATNVAFRMGWRMARVTEEMLGIEHFGSIDDKEKVGG